MSLVVSVAAYAMVGLGLRERVPRDIVVYGLTLAGAYLLAWGVVRWTAPRADPVLLPIAGMLGGLGLAMIYRLLPADVADEQALWLLIGLAAFVLTLLLVRDDRQLDAYTYTIGLLGLLLLLMPVVPGIGFATNGARLWARIGPLTFQPAEFGKILVVIFLASYLSAKRELLEAGVGRLGLPRAKDLGPLLLAWGASLAVLFLERDLGASLLFFGVFVVMLWVASGRVGYLIVGGRLFAAGAADRVPRLLPRPGARRVLAPCAGARQGQRLRLRPAGAELVRARLGRVGRHRPGPRLTGSDPVPRERLHPLGVR